MYLLQINPGQVGFYRVQYSSAMLELLLPAINDNSLPPRDRLGLQSDLFALVCKGKPLALTCSLNVSNYFGIYQDLNVLHRNIIA